MARHTFLDEFMLPVVQYQQLCVWLQLPEQLEAHQRLIEQVRETGGADVAQGEAPTRVQRPLQAVEVLKIRARSNDLEARRAVAQIAERAHFVHCCPGER